METDRRTFLTGATALTSSLFAGQVKGANDRVALAYIGVGRMGQDNLAISMRQENVVPVAVCDVYEPNLQKAVQISKGKAKAVRDFREILADKSIDAVCIAAPDHWHAYMTVEACKAGKDVYVEKPVCVAVEEGKKMVEAARKYKRVVQAGTMQRSAEHFQKACEIVRSGQLGKVVFVRTWNYGHAASAGIGNPPDTDPPADLDWNMWLGPAPQRPFNKNRFGVDPNAYSHFRWFWDYAGGMMTDWGVHWLDIVQMAFGEEMPASITALGGKFWLQDNRDTPDTLQVTYRYPSGFIATYENREANSESMFDKSGGILFCGTKGTMFLDRRGYKIVPETGYGKDKTPLMEGSEMKAVSSGNVNHWRNFLE